MAEFMTLARPYARAAFDYADSSSALDKWSTALLSLAYYVELADVEKAINHPGLSRQARVDTLLELSGKDSEGNKLENFLNALAETDRLGLLPAISALFERYKAERNQAVDVLVTSAFELTDAEKTTLTSALSSRLKKNVLLATEIDKTLIGGVVIHAGDMTIDGSVRGRLQKLSEAIL